MTRKRSSNADKDDDGDEIVTLQLGPDVFAARVIASACEAAGLRVQLMPSDSPARPYGGAEFGNRLLVRQRDVARVERIIKRST